ncbi:MAG: antitermination protein NusG [Phycisphaerae bacterium]|nr:antitermination protein NusG [Phycisphaerae bacterium]
MADFVGRWWVAHTKPRQEKALAWDIFRSGGRYFLPMYEKIKRSRSRRWTSVLPLFTGYVFLCCDESERLRALETQRIAKLIPVPDQAGLVVELSRIRQLLAGGLSIDPYPGLTKGSACRIRTGPLAGLEGHVERRKNQARFVVNVTILGQGAAVEIDADWLEPIEGFAG